MAKRENKSVSLVGFTNDAMRVGNELFTDDVISTGGKGIVTCNYLGVHVCAKERKEKCDESKRCCECSPQGDHARRSFLNLTKRQFKKLGWEDQYKKVEAKLYREWRRCREVKLTVREI